MTEFATGLKKPRVIVRAPNGDLFVAESQADRIRVLRDADGDGKPEVNEVFADGPQPPLRHRLLSRRARARASSTSATPTRSSGSPTANGDLKARGKPEVIVDDIPSGDESVGGGGHWTRDLAFSKDGKTLFVSVGSRSNVTDDEKEERRACILAFDPDGKNERLYASGIRNPVGLAIHPETGELWTSVNERDELGDNLVPDYVTRVRGGRLLRLALVLPRREPGPAARGQAPRAEGQGDRARRADPVALGLARHDLLRRRAVPRGVPAATPSPPSTARGTASRRTGYKVIRIPMKDGKATGEYEDFLTGFVTEDGDVWGRPVGVATAKDGSLMVTDDGSGTVWRVAYVGEK